MQNTTPPILLIYGPTASGKSALAVAFAQKCGGEIINADSMQVYRGLPILTAQPSLAERGQIIHHLYGHIDPSQPYSVGAWLDQAKAAIKTVRQKGKMPILVGGTGLYFAALTNGLAQIPKVAPPAMAKAEHLLDTAGMDALRKEVARTDPAAAARIKGADRQRLLRAYSVYLQTGQSLTSFQVDTSPVLNKDDWFGVCLLPDREQLYARIHERFLSMIERGALGEVQSLLDQKLDAALPAMKALGLPHLAGLSQGETEHEVAIEMAVRDTRRYAKRQYTWARGRFAHWPVIATINQLSRMSELLNIMNYCFEADKTNENSAGKP